MRRFLVVATLLATPCLAQSNTTTTETAGFELTATIVAIDHTGREVTLRGKDGAEETLLAGPEIKRFNELKVGDTVTFKYYESIAKSIRRAGEAAPVSGSGAPTITAGKGERPGGTVAQQHTMTVTVTGIDPKVPSVKVVTPRGTRSFRVENPENIKDLKLGDKVDLTYTEAVLISVK
jgi:hypothetical protein